MSEVKNSDYSRIAQDLQIRKTQVESVVALLDQGNTVPFITRYRKERTEGLNEEHIRHIQRRILELRELAERKQTILKTIENQGKLNDELRQAILQADSRKRLEDLYLPYKPKKRSLATVACERGLEPLALAIWSRDPAVGTLNEMWPTVVNPDKELHSADDVRIGVGHILAEWIAEHAEVRAAVRTIIWQTGKVVVTKSETLPEGKGGEYKDYFTFTEDAGHIPPHRILAINRGQKANALRVKIDWDTARARQAALVQLPFNDHPHAEYLATVLDDALVRLLQPSLEREVRRELTQQAEAHAVKVFARNLRGLLLQPPLRGRRVLAIDPGFKTGCKVAVLGECGDLLEDTIIFPHPPQKQRAEAMRKLVELICKHQSPVIAIGNGTACRETEELVSDLLSAIEKRHLEGPKGDIAPETLGAAVALASAQGPGSCTIIGAFQCPDEVLTVTAAAPPAEAAGDIATPDTASTDILSVHAGPAGNVPPEIRQTLTSVQPGLVSAPTHFPWADWPQPPADLAYVIVNEAGASVYSTSGIAREEFPDRDATLRGTVSIGRRLQDPLSELVKIDPQNLGVGLYQHDVSPKYLKESLESIVESSVNHVGIDLNTASAPLLRYVAGMNQLVAHEVVEYRKQHGPFRSRQALRDVPNIGDSRWTQAAGFLKITDGDNPLDRTSIHPESYAVAERLLAELGHAPASLADPRQTEELRRKLRSLSPEEVARQLEVGVPTVRDILEALARPGRDPREDLPPPIFKKGIMRVEDLRPGMELKGTVLNVVDFGAFVDIGLKDSGLVHISQMANRYIRSTYDVVSVGDVVTVWVLEVEQGRHRVSLTMIAPGTPRHGPQRKPVAPRTTGVQEGQSAPHGTPQSRGRRPRRRGSHKSQVATPPAAAEGQPAAPVAQAATTAPAPPPVAATARAPAPPPKRKPHRSLPKPRLSQAALERKVPLRSFSELEVFFEAKDQPSPPADA
jgi:uncharacterized protein